MQKAKGKSILKIIQIWIPTRSEDCQNSRENVIDLRMLSNRPEGISAKLQIQFKNVLNVIFLADSINTAGGLISPLSVTQIYLIIQILGGEYLIFEYEYLFSSLHIYLIFILSQIDLTIYSVNIR